MSQSGFEPIAGCCRTCSLILITQSITHSQKQFSTGRSLRVRDALRSHERCNHRESIQSLQRDQSFGKSCAYVETGTRTSNSSRHRSCQTCVSKWSRRVLEALDEVWSPAAGSYAMAQLNELVDIDAVAEDSGARPKINQRSNIREQNAQVSTHEISEFSALNASHLADVYRISRKRLLIFNYTGTLVPQFTKEFECVEEHSET